MFIRCFFLFFLILERVNKITRNQTRLRFWEKPKKK